MMQFFDGPRDRQRREALPFPLRFASFLESRLRAVELSLGERAFAGAVLLLIVSSLRFSDASHVEWRSLSMDAIDLRGLSTRTKTSSNGMPFAASGLGFLGCPGTPVSSWVSHYLQVLGCLWGQMCSHFGDAFCPDTLFFLWDPNEPVFVPMSYAQALHRLRGLLEQFFPEGSVMSYTLHSAKATMLSWCAEALIPKHMAQVQGHHAVDTQRKYARDDTFLALSAQRMVLHRLLEGWCPAVPIARGAQVPMSNEPLQLCAMLSQSACHPRFPYHNQNNSTQAVVQQLPVPEVTTASTAVPAGLLGSGAGSSTSLALRDDLAPGSDPQRVRSPSSDSSSEAPMDASDDLGKPDEVLWVRSGKGVFHAAVQAEHSSSGVRAACGTFLLNPAVSDEPPPTARLCCRAACVRCRIG